MLTNRPPKGSRKEQGTA